MSYILTFSGFRDGGADDISDGQAIFRLREPDGAFASWNTDVNHVEVSSVLVRHHSNEISAELVFNGDESMFVEVPLRSLLEIAPPGIPAFLTANCPRTDEPIR